MHCAAEAQLHALVDSQCMTAAKAQLYALAALQQGARLYFIRQVAPTVRVLNYYTKSLIGYCQTSVDGLEYTLK